MGNGGHPNLGLHILSTKGVSDAPRNVGPKTPNATFGGAMGKT